MTGPASRPSLGELQDGIYIERGKPPPASWLALLLNVDPGTTPAMAGDAIGATMAMLADLRLGKVRDLTAGSDGEEPGLVPADTFATLIGFGASLFDAERHQPPLTTLPRPRHLVPLRRQGAAFPSLPWDPGAARSGEADLLLQFTGKSEHAVARAAVEVSKLIDDEALPLTIATTHTGFQRDDRRSWIGFHDGVTNIEPSQRRAAVECLGDPDWNRGGTYLAFLRVQVDLAAWRRLTREQQEAVVGRDKLSGCPLVAIEKTGGGLRPRSTGTHPPDASADWRDRDAYFNPAETTDPLVEASHIHRANQARAAGGTPAGERIFRQGYEYLDGIGPDGPRLGLNFVSFQRDIQRLQQLLNLDGWLGDVNFGGPVEPGLDDPPTPALLSLNAGGFYAVPPRGTPFPGAHLFGGAGPEAR